MNTTPRILWLVLLCYATLYVVWGSTYYFIKITVVSIPPVWAVGLRFLCGGVVMLLCSMLAGRFVRYPAKKEWSTILFLAVFLLMGGNLLVNFSEREVDSYLAALIISCTPIADAVFNRILFKINLSIIRAIGIGLGIGGVALLLYDGQGFVFSINIYIVLLFMALTFWAFGTCMSSKLNHYPDVFIDSSLQMIAAGVICCIIAPFSDGIAWVKDVQMVSVYGLLYLIVMGSLPFAAYNYLLAVEPPQRISSYALVNPLIATVIGIVFAREKPVAGLWASLFAIITGVVLMVYGGSITGFIKSRIKQKAS